MLSFKKNYYLILESIKDINLSTIKKHNKFVIIYRNKGKNENQLELIAFRKKCKLNANIIKFFELPIHIRGL